jgi:aryl-alcohol dehydrogenase-like predicted oxidoreductase
MERIRDGIFLATKTGDRDAESAWASINRSLERLQTDHVDLIQLHAVGDLAELDRCTEPGGALEAVVRAREEGLARAIGITGHGHEAPATHREALRRFDFQAVLTPYNYVLSRRTSYADDYHALVADCEQRGAALRLIKTVARRNWVDGADHEFATWYEPLADAGEIRAAVSWALAEPGVAGLATPGDVRLLGDVIAAEADRQSQGEAEAELDRTADLSSPFLNMPF